MRTFRPGGHPAHPPLTDFPLALWIFGAVAAVVAALATSPTAWTVSRWTIGIGLLAALPTVVSGLLDLGALPRKSPPVPVAFRHMLSMVVAGGSFFFVWLLSLGSPAPGGWRLAGLLVLAGIGLVSVLVGGWLGGHLIFAHGVGVALRGGRAEEERLPEEEERRAG